MVSSALLVPVFVPLFVATTCLTVPMVTLLLISRVIFTDTNVTGGLGGSGGGGGGSV